MTQTSKTTAHTAHTDSELVEQAFAAADAAEQTTGEPAEVDYVAVLIAAIRSTTKS